MTDSTHTANCRRSLLWRLAIFPHIYRSIYLSIYLTNYLSIHPSIHLSNLSIYPSIYPSIYLSIQPSIYLSSDLSTYLSIHPSIYLSIHPCILVSLRQFHSLPHANYPEINCSLGPHVIYWSTFPLSVCLAIRPVFLLHLSLDLFTSLGLSLCPYRLSLSTRLSTRLPPIILNQAGQKSRARGNRYPPSPICDLVRYPAKQSHMTP